MALTLNQFLWMIMTVIAFIVGIFLSIRLIYGIKSIRKKMKVDPSIINEIEKNIDNAIAFHLKKIPINKNVDVEINSVGNQTFSERINKLEEGLRSIKNLLFDDPESLVSISLMKKNVEILLRENENIRKELDRQNTSTKWFVGILVTVFISLLGLAITILLK